MSGGLGSSIFGGLELLSPLFLSFVPIAVENSVHSSPIHEGGRLLWQDSFFGWKETKGRFKGKTDLGESTGLVIVFVFCALFGWSW